MLCSRCGREGQGLDSAPLPGPLGEELLAHTCAPCWLEWQEMEVKVINELRLNFMDPEASRALESQMRTFLMLPAADC